MGKTKEQIAAREAVMAARGRRMKALIAVGRCPMCGKPLDPEQPTRRLGEEHGAYEVGGLVYVPCLCDAGCGHIPVRRRGSLYLKRQ